VTLPQRIAHIVKHGLAVLHPCVYGELGVKGAVDSIAADLEKEVALLCPGRDAKEIVGEFVDELGEIRRLVETDIDAAYEGDPAATSRMEVVMAYPGLYAVTIHRIAHVLYRLKVPVIPRIMSELAHSRTGIDIHPGATIGERFFIDHGTGVVIGETAVIGRNVKIYQGVTLGALSFAKDPETGALVKGIKRHPNVEDNVVIYAGATILGGETVIGHDSEVGGNVWLKDSIPPFSRVYNKPPAPTIKSIAGGR
jgi:serine O-acetyltransferase